MFYTHSILASDPGDPPSIGIYRDKCYERLLMHIQKQHGCIQIKFNDRLIRMDTTLLAFTEALTWIRQVFPLGDPSLAVSNFDAIYPQALEVDRTLTLEALEDQIGAQAPKTKRDPLLLTLASAVQVLIEHELNPASRADKLPLLEQALRASAKQWLAQLHDLNLEITHHLQNSECARS